MSIDKFVKEHPCNGVQMDEVRLDKLRGTFKLKLKSIEYREMSMTEKGTMLPMRMVYMFNIEEAEDPRLVGKEANLWIAYHGKKAERFFKVENLDLWTAFAPSLDSSKLVLGFDEYLVKFVKTEDPNVNPILDAVATAIITSRGDEGQYAKIDWAPVV